MRLSEKRRGSVQVNGDGLDWLRSIIHGELIEPEHA